MSVQPLPRPWQKENLRPGESGGLKASNAAGNLFPVAPDCLYRTAFHRFLAESCLRIILGLFINVAVAAIVVALEVRRSRFTAEVAIDALVVDVKSPTYVFRILVRLIGHKEMGAQRSDRSDEGNAFFRPRFGWRQRSSFAYKGHSA